MKNYNLCCIGYITRDTIITPQSTIHMPGGTSYYFAKAISRLDAEGFLLVTSVADEDRPVVDELQALGIDVLTTPTRHSVCFDNIYGDNPNDRRQRVTAQADPFSPEALAHLQADTIHLGTLLANDFSPEVIKQLSTCGKLSVDVQGFLRKVVDEQVLPVDWTEKKQVLKYVHTLQANENEMRVLTGCTDPHEAALLIADWGVREVLLTLGDRGSLIYANGQFYDIPAYPAANVVDATGCGDTYMAGYLWMRARGASHYQAGCFAAAMCTLKLQQHGPFNGNRETVERIIGQGGQ